VSVTSVALAFAHALKVAKPSWKQGLLQVLISVSSVPTSFHCLPFSNIATWQDDTKTIATSVSICANVINRKVSHQDCNIGVFPPSGYS
jgi:hypothetical protein